MNDLISVIVPVYNVENYLVRCLDSILMQTYPRFEVLLIDDGSTDKSGAVCDAYAEKDCRIKVIHQKNRGLAAARNVGIDASQGNYLIFVDSDDYVHKDYLRFLYETAIEYQSDLVACHHKKILTESADLEKLEKPKVQILSREQMLEQMLEGKAFDVMVWGKLYKASLFQGLRYPEGRLFEDVCVTYRLVDKCERGTYVSATLYYYTQRPDSIMRQSRFHASLMDAVAFNWEMAGFVKEKYPSIYETALYRFFRSNRRTLRIARRTLGYWAEKRILLGNIAQCKSVVLQREPENKKMRLLVAVACLAAKMDPRCNRMTH